MHLRPFSLITALALALTSVLHADTAAIESKLRESLSKLDRSPDSDAKAKEIFKATIAEIDDYVKTAEPKEKVKAQALQLQLLFASGEKEKAAKTLAPEVYKQLAKGKDGDINEALPAIAIQVMGKIADGDKKAAKALLDTFEKDFAEHPQMAERGDKMVKSMLGKLALPGAGDTMEIAFTALDGTKVDLAAMKGKVVLVDFWATWCGPCVGELPNVKAAYKAYHDKGFEILGISLDQDEDALKAFLKKNEMTWAQAFDGKGWQNEIAQKFGIHSIPATFLVGKDGKIAASDLRGSALEEKLAEMLK